MTAIKESAATPELPPQCAVSAGRRELMIGGGRLLLGLPLMAGGFAPLQAHAQASAADGSPRRGGTLVIAMSADPASLNPDLSTGVTDHTAGELIYEGLTEPNDDFTMAPALAKSWKISPDGLTYAFTLIEAKWHDGKPFTSADVKYTLDEVASKYAAKFAAAAALIKRVDAPDPRSVVITLSKPYAPLLFSLSAFGGAAILPRHLFEGTNPLNNPATLTTPVGTGPFKLKSWQRGDRLTLERNPDYWRGNGRPYLDQIVLRIIPDGSTRVLAMQAGEVDYSYFYFYPPSRLKEAQDDPHLQLRDQAVPEDKVLIINTRNKPFQDVRVRQALTHAINREYIEKVVYRGLSRTMKNHMDSRLKWAFDPSIDLDTMYPVDIPAAKKLLADAGLNTDDHPLEVRLVYDSTDVDFGRLAEVLSAMWRKIGVKVVFVSVPRNVMLEKIFTNWDFDVTIQAYTTSGDPALGVSRLYTTSAIQKRPFMNASGYSNPEVDKLFDDAASTAGFEARGVLYKAAARILARDLPVIPIWETAGLNVASKKVHGSWAHGTGYSGWDGVWIDA
ncbi:MAG TPA: ABC transporter substrate-binding protein [Burkholderiaceae bacterium]|jgi:peptide/nickel transport system substrate-binding protein